MHIHTKSAMAHSASLPSIHTRSISPDRSAIYGEVASLNATGGNSQSELLPGTGSPSAPYRLSQKSSSDPMMQAKEQKDTASRGSLPVGRRSSTADIRTDTHEKARPRMRRTFTQEEDEALKRGFGIHGSQWAQIARDPVFQNRRSSTDVRDRFRNAFPEEYARAGYKPRIKSSKRSDKNREALNQRNQRAARHDPPYTRRQKRSDDLDSAAIGMPIPLGMSTPVPGSASFPGEMDAYAFVRSNSMDCSGPASVSSSTAQMDAMTAATAQPTSPFSPISPFEVSSQPSLSISPTTPLTEPLTSMASSAPHTMSLPLMTPLTTPLSMSPPNQSTHVPYTQSQSAAAAAPVAPTSPLALDSSTSLAMPPTFHNISQFLENQPFMPAQLNDPRQHPPAPPTPQDTPLPNTLTALLSGTHASQTPSLFPSAPSLSERTTPTTAELGTPCLSSAPAPAPSEPGAQTRNASDIDISLLSMMMQSPLPLDSMQISGPLPP